MKIFLLLPFLLGLGKLPDAGVVSPSTGSFYDPKLDYSVIKGRVTDRDDVGNTLKIKTENQNIKFFKQGDSLSFTIATYEKERCHGFIQGVERSYITITVKDLKACWYTDRYFRRGIQVEVKAPVLEKRVRDASSYRTVLLQKKTDFLEQLQGVNQFLWTYEQKRLQLAASYEQQMVAIEEQKRKALNDFIQERKKASTLQKELQGSLTNIDQELDFFRLERQEQLIDRWNKDHDLGHPVKRRPPELLIPLERERWHSQFTQESN